MNKESCFHLGYITKPHGLKGEAVLFLDVDIPEQYYEMESVFVERDNRLIPFFIESLVPGRDKKVIVAFEDIRNLNELQRLIGAAIWLPTQVLPKLEEGFYFHDVIGYTVIDNREGPLGTIKAFYETGPQTLMAMDYQGQEVLIPVTDEIVGQADHKKQSVAVQLPDGLLDLYFEDQDSETDDAD